MVPTVLGGSGGLETCPLFGVLKAAGGIRPKLAWWLWKCCCACDFCGVALMSFDFIVGTALAE